MLHDAYYAVLAHLDGREDSAEWRATVAGLVLLRLVDRWIACPREGNGYSVRDAPVTSADDLNPAALGELVAAARDAAAAVESADSKRQLLLALVEAAATGSTGDMARALLLYAHTLHTEATWPLAADVYGTVYRLATAPTPVNGTDLEVLGPVALERVGYAKRMMGDLDGAAASYMDGRAAAIAQGDKIRDLRIRLSEANLLIHVGNLPRAVVALESILDEASQHPEEVSRGRDLARSLRLEVPLLDIDLDTRDIIALARHARGTVAAMLGDHALALEHYFAAWVGYRDPARRERVWLDMAFSLANIGVRNAAHDAYAVLHLTAREREARLTAALNLMELATMDGREDVAMTYRAEIESAAASGALPAWLAPWAAYHSGKAEARFGRPEHARALFMEALELAKQAQVNEVTIRADAALAALVTGGGVEHPSSALPVIPPAVIRIARTIRRVRKSHRLTSDMSQRQRRAPTAPAP